MNEPKIRFKGFQGEWKNSLIGDISSSFSGGTPSAGVAEYYGGDIPFIRSGEIHSNKTELFLTKKGLNSSSAKIVEKGTLLYALYGATSGEVGISQLRGAINQAILAIYPNKNVDKRFLAHFLQSHKDKIVGELLQGGQGNLSGALVKNISVFYPLKDEQEIIADYIDGIDAQISATTSRLASLKQVKEASLQAMFPQEGETVPKIRFKGFQGEWKKVTLDKLLTVNSGRDYKHLHEGNIPVYGTGGYMLSVDRSLSDCDAIGIGRKGTIDKPQFLKSPFWTVDTLFYLTTKKDDNLYFLFNLSQSIEWGKYDESTGLPSLSKNNIEKIETFIPGKEEQQAIASYFTSLDHQIKAQGEKIEKLKQIKAACLDKMFV